MTPVLANKNFTTPPSLDDDHVSVDISEQGRAQSAES